jgi:hypothetical protein
MAPMQRPFSVLADPSTHPGPKSNLQAGRCDLPPLGGPLFPRAASTSLERRKKHLPLRLRPGFVPRHVFGKALVPPRGLRSGRPLPRRRPRGAFPSRLLSEAPLSQGAQRLSLRAPASAGKHLAQRALKDPSPGQVAQASSSQGPRPLPGEAPRAASSSSCDQPIGRGLKAPTPAGGPGASPSREEGLEPLPRRGLPRKPMPGGGLGESLPPREGESKARRTLHGT